MLSVGYCFGIRSERRLCEEVHLNLAYRWFCRLDLTVGILDHSTFSKNCQGRFHESDLLRHVFEMTVAPSIQEGLWTCPVFVPPPKCSFRSPCSRMRTVARQAIAKQSAGRGAFPAQS